MASSIPARLRPRPGAVAVAAARRSPGAAARPGVRAARLRARLCARGARTLSRLVREPGARGAWRRWRRRSPSSCSAGLVAHVARRLEPAGAIPGAGGARCWRWGSRPLGSRARRGGGAARRVGLWTGLAGAAEPRLVTGTATARRRSSVRLGAVEWTRLLPGYVLADPSASRCARLDAALAAAAWRRRGSATGPSRRADERGPPWPCGAAIVSRRTLDGRDAVRVLGRPAPAGCRGFAAAAPARWTGSLSWGPVRAARDPEGPRSESGSGCPPGPTASASRGSGSRRRRMLRNEATERPRPSSTFGAGTVRKSFSPGSSRSRLPSQRLVSLRSSRSCGSSPQPFTRSARRINDEASGERSMTKQIMVGTSPVARCLGVACAASPGTSARRRTGGPA